jgi:hypothetical protein
MRASPTRRHAAASIAPERHVHLHGLDLQRRGGNLVEDAMRVEWPVVAADSSVIASDDLMGATVVLSEERVQ